MLLTNKETKTGTEHHSVKSGNKENPLEGPEGKMQEMREKENSSETSKIGYYLDC